MTNAQGSLLLVDDEELNRDMLSKRLTLKGFAVTTAENGPRALALIDREAFDLVLLDVMMPEMNGLEVLRRLRREYSQAELPVIMATANGRSEDVVEALSLGANDYLTKPIDFPVALARIATQLSHKRAHAELRASETRYALAARGTGDGLWDWDLDADAVYYSPRWKAMLGYDGAEIGASPDEWLLRVHADDRERVRADFAAHCARRTAQFECEHRVLHRDETYRWMVARGVAVWGRNGKALRMAGSLSEVTDGKVADALTGLPNRIDFMDRVERALERSRRVPDSRFAVLFLDLDRFKLINDSLGHVVGDHLLIAFARRVESCVRSTDIIVRPGAEHTIARLGGDEFTILLDGIDDVSSAVNVADRIQKELATPFRIDGHEIFASSSIGILVAGPDYERADDLVRDADTAMYDAKAKGKARYELFDPSMRERALARLQLEAELRGALKDREFSVHYLPIIAQETDRLIGFEAMVHWNHPQRGVLGPAEFGALAEKTGQIVPIGWWILEEACGQMASWHAQFPETSDLFLCVRIAPKQFLQPDLVEQVERRLRQTGLAPTSLKLDITESAVVSDLHTAAATLARLRALGIRIGIENFGSAYSTLSCLHGAPVDTLKIDRSFVDHLDVKPGDSGIVQAIVTLAQTLAVEVVAKGLEMSHQRTPFLTLGSEGGWGAYVFEAMDGRDAGALLAACQRAPGAGVPPSDTSPSHVH
jgi:diguanylate cyclase (GGDEF)-like protein/PAS domain S-box-containing protein